ncbi:MAG: HAMP domain-containing protein [Crocinitomicaceae bacterium]|nr:HAMP domain-containing protein [Crocinitomicaceae bacterium]
MSFKGNLDERVAVTGNNEVTVLSEQFNSMIDQLQESYATLEQKVEDRTVAAADCTGHIFYVVCSNALHRTVNEFGIINPAEILNSTRKLIIETFAKSDREVKDGMDISLCRIDLKNLKMIFCGANNPLWLIRDKKHLTKLQLESESILMNDSFALLEFKANKQPVGLYAGMKFYTEEIDLMKGDTISFSLMAC